MTTPPAARTAQARSFEVRHVQIARAVFAAIAAVMVTFSTDHSAEVGLSVFSGFAIATGLILLLAVWLVYPSGQRWPSAVLGTLSILAGMTAGIVPLRSITLFFAVVIAWALTTGLFEALAGWLALRRARASKDAAGSASRDELIIGILTIVLGVALLLVPAQYALQYTIQEADATFTLTGIIIGVGLFGGYAAIVAVYLAIAGFSPRTPSAPSPEHTETLKATHQKGAS